MKPYTIALIVAVLVALVTASPASGSAKGSAKGSGGIPSKQQTILDFHDSLLYPNNIPYFVNGTVPGNGIFTADLIGRVTPYFNMTGGQNWLDYFYSTTPNITDYRFDQVFLSDYIEQGNSVYTTVDLRVRNGFVNPPLYFNFTTAGVWKFTNQGLINHFDLTIKNFNSFFLQLGSNWTDPTYINSEIVKTCTRYFQYCNGYDNTYANQADCTGFLNGLLGSDRLGGPEDMFTMNSVWCRSVHSAPLLLRPAVHCPHVGRTGGNMCIDLTYNAFYDFPSTNDNYP